MNISHEWLSDFVDWKEKDPQKIATAMTVSMGEVDEVSEQGALLEKCVVGKVLKKEKHSNADKLSVCVVETDDGNKKVVCGGTNVREGMLVAFAHIGATVQWHGEGLMTLEKVKIRGEESEGMICAEEELGLSMFPPSKEDGAHPIVDLTSRKLKVGTPLKKALKMNDTVYHIDNHAITNRPDLFSHIGVARELVAMGMASWKKQPSVRKPKFPSSSMMFKTKNSVPKLIPRYFGCTMQIDSLGVTPDWMRSRLEAIGVRSINLPVDITNYVSAEFGMPLHSFDIGDITGNIDMRTSKKGEKIVTLDEVERELPDGALVLSDDEGIFDLLGIMGGLRSSTKETTKNIYLHAAVVDPVSIRRAIIATNHRTDASTVYEKGIPHSAAEAGFFRALELMLAHIPGAKVTSKLETQGKDEKHGTIELPNGHAEKVIGASITTATSKKILSSLGYEVKAKGKGLMVTPPAWRKDVSGTHDVVEDIARIVGYNDIKSVTPVAPINPPERDVRTNVLRDALKDSGFHETLHLAFVGTDMLNKAALDAGTAINVDNPLGEELSLMRTHLFPRILETIAREERANPKEEIRLFEVGKVFFEKKKEGRRMTLAVRAERNPSIGDDPMLHAKAATLHALEKMGYHDVTVEEATPPPYAHPGRCGALKINGKAVGFLWTLHPTISENFGIKGSVGLCSLDLETLFSAPSETKVFESLPTLPSVEFDETLPLSAGSHAARAKAATASSLLKNIVVQSYYGKGKDANVTLRFVYRSDEKTLTEEEAKKEHTKVLQSVQNS